MCLRQRKYCETELLHSCTLSAISQLENVYVFKVIFIEAPLLLPLICSQPIVVLWMAVLILESFFFL